MENSDLLQTFVEEDGGYKKEGRNWGRSEKHSSLVVNEEAQRWFWNSEQMGGTALDYLILIRKLPRKAAEAVIKTRGRIITGSFHDKEEEIYYVPQERLVDLLWELGKGNREYWYKRLLTDKTIDRYRLGFYDGWYLVPIYRDNVFVNFQMRRDVPSKLVTQWYKTETWQPSLINSDVLSIVDTVFIVEGTIDCLLLNQEGIPSVAQNTIYWNNKWFPLFNNVKNIYYIADNDSAGRGAAKRVAKSLGVDRVKIYQFEGLKEKYDTVDYFRDGGNAKDFRRAVEQDSKNLFEIGELLNESRLRHRWSY